MWLKPISSGKNIGGPRGSKGTSGLSQGIKGGVRSVTGGQARRLGVPGVQGGGQGCARGSSGTKEFKGEFRGVSEGTSREVPRVEWGGLRGRGGLDM